jgi:hypothetical protein
MRCSLSSESAGLLFESPSLFGEDRSRAEHEALASNFHFGMKYARAASLAPSLPNLFNRTHQKLRLTNL